MKKAVIFHLNYFRFLVWGEEGHTGEDLIGALKNI